MGQVIIAGGAVVGELVQTVTALTAGSTVTVDCSKGNVFTLTPAQAEAVNATNVTNGEKVVINVLTSGTSSYTLTFGTNFVTTGTLATGTTSAKNFIIEFVSVGGNLIEVARTTAM